MLLTNNLILSLYKLFYPGIEVKSCDINIEMFKPLYEIELCIPFL